MQDTYIEFKAERGVQVMIVEDIRHASIGHHTKSPWRINLTMVRAKYKRTSTLKQRFALAVMERTPEMLRPSNEDLVLISFGRKSILKLAADTMADPGIVPTIVVAHPGSFFGTTPFPFPLFICQLHSVRLFRVLNRKQIIRQRNLPDVLPKRAIVQIGLAGDLVLDVGGVDGVGDSERENVRALTLAGVDQGTVIGPVTTVQRVGSRHANGTFPRPGLTDAVEAVELALAVDGCWGPGARTSTRVDRALVGQHRAHALPRSIHARCLVIGYMKPSLEHVVMTLVDNDIGIVGRDVGDIREREVIGGAIGLGFMLLFGVGCTRCWHGGGQGDQRGQQKTETRSNHCEWSVCIGKE